MSSRLIWATPVLILLAGLLLFACSSDDENPVVPPPEVPTPSAPEFFIVADTSPTFLRLEWEDVSDDEIGFRVERSLQESTGFAELDTTAADLTEYTDGTVEAGGRYYYLSNVNQLLSQLVAKQEENRITDYRKLYNLPGLFFIFVGLLTLEWILRKKWRLV